ncbi:MAG TPA: FKBP-type peptidyl-prolyl cis-trans isomerase [Thermoanaerobaculia bacterium]|nr:FKBP-type peptidyl-prolyl cis-trans isomerase [Thermoanaerobaculia bacterium]
MNRRFLPCIPASLLALSLSLPLGAAPQAPAAPAAESLPAPADVAAPPADAQVTASGLASKVLSPGTGTEHPAAADQVKAHYTGWTTDGKMFDSSVARGRPIVLPLNRVIAGWTEGLQLMVVGEKRRFWIPAKLAYEGKPDKPQGTLVFDVELLEILRVPPAPADLATPPTDAASHSSSGLVWKVLKPGTGTRHPKGTSTVKVHYTGWTTDGKMFDSSYSRGTPTTFPLNKVIPGWTEGLKLMTEGESRRFWIPKKLAYRGAPGKPEGMLVFDVDLLEIVKE